jgi:chlorobactene glucosyltransferase
VSLGWVFGPATTALCVAMVVIVVWNLRTMTFLRAATGPAGPPDPADPAGPPGPAGPLVSVLVPARNEAATIATCIEALLAQQHPALEVVVLDDRSDDGTADVVRAVAAGDPRVRVVDGAELPDGWTGKNWACHQLSQQARGEVLCFVDADTVLDPAAIGGALGVLRDDGADLVTLLLAADDTTTAQAVLLPMVNHVLLALFPVALMHRPGPATLALALGPFIMVTRDAYDACGGHAAAPDDVVDDVRLCRAVKATGRSVRLVNGTAVARTRWYASVGETWRGFSKNAFGALDTNLPLAAATVLLVMPMLCAPFLRLAAGLAAGDVAGEVWVQVGLIVAVRVVTSLAGRDPMWTGPLHPLAVVFWGAALLWSVVITTTGRSVEWRGRTVAVRSTR